MPMASEWWENYVGETVPTNHFSIYTQQDMGTEGILGGMEDEIWGAGRTGRLELGSTPTADSFIEK